jgi:hypothetical protein
VAARDRLSRSSSTNTIEEARVEITPNDAKLLYSLTGALDMLGFAEEAKRHWQAYLTHDPFASPWSEHARQRLNAIGYLMLPQRSLRLQFSWLMALPI